MALTYSSYLKVDELLKLQKPLSDGPEHDEMLFIVIHQVYELWFKQMLHELDYLKKNLRAHQLPFVLATQKRMLTILKTMVGQIDILETMTPLSFNSFRSRLESSSGFQSFQFREFELALGSKGRTFLKYFEGTPEVLKKLERRFEEPSLYDDFLFFIHQSGFSVPDSVLKRDVRETGAANESVQKVLIEVYQKDPILSQVCERLVDLDEGIQEWRYRHVKMVERTIGSKMGTGGSLGAEYPKKTLFQPLFPDLWAIRSQF